MTTHHQNTPDRTNTFEFPTLDPATLGNAMQAYQAWLNCMMTLNAEATKFVTKRIQCDAQLPVSIIECHSPEDIVKTQIEFFKTMADDYSQQANRVGTIVSQSVQAMEHPPLNPLPLGQRETQRKAA